MVRLIWLLIGLIAAMGGGDLALRGWVGLLGWLVLGIGAGIVLAVVGSWVHDALAGAREKL